MSIERAETAFNFAIQVYNDGQTDNFDSHEDDKGITAVQKFGYRWILPRVEFLEQTFSCLIAIVSSLAKSIFYSAFALIKGEGFKDTQLNDLAVREWKGCGNCAIYALECFVGIFAPSGAKWLEENVHSKINSNPNGNQEPLDESKSETRTRFNESGMPNY